MPLSQQNWTPLHLASNSGRLPVVTLLVDKGANLQEDSPILHLRNNLVRGSNASNNNISYDISAWFLKAFALHVRNEPCQKLHFSPSREHFPDLAKLLA